MGPSRCFIEEPWRWAGSTPRKFQSLSGGSFPVESHHNWAILVKHLHSEEVKIPERFCLNFLASFNIKYSCCGSRQIISGTQHTKYLLCWDFFWSQFWWSQFWCAFPCLRGPWGPLCPGPGPDTISAWGYQPLSQWVPSWSCPLGHGPMFDTLKRSADSLFSDLLLCLDCSFCLYGGNTEISELRANLKQLVSYVLITVLLLGKEGTGLEKKSNLSWS